jgi:glutamate/tyrosine decarboxylase-like PLP-dependent enzyme
VPATPRHRGESDDDLHENAVTLDFRLSHVRSINLSKHKFGLVYPGMGTVVFRDRADLPDELVVHIGRGRRRTSRGGRPPCRTPTSSTGRPGALVPVLRWLL